MNKLNFLPKLAIAGVATGISALSVPMEANAAGFVIDDYNVTESREVDTDPLTPTVPSVTNDVSKIDINSDIWPADWDRTQLDVVTVVGDPGEGRLCMTCGAFEMLSGAGNSQNIAGVNYAGPTTDLSVYDGWWVFYSADLDGGDLSLLTDRNGALEVLAQAIDLPSTGGAGPQFLEPLKLEWLTDDLTVDNLRVEIDGTGVGNLDFTVDGVKKAPEPGTILGLLAVSGFGFGLKRKKQS